MEAHVGAALTIDPRQGHANYAFAVFDRTSSLRRFIPESQRSQGRSGKRLYEHLTFVIVEETANACEMVLGA